MRQKQLEARAEKAEAEVARLRGAVTEIDAHAEKAYARGASQTDLTIIRRIVLVARETVEQERTAHGQMVFLIWTD